MTSSPNRTLFRTNRFFRDAKPLPKSVQEEAFSVAQKLCENVFHQELNVRELVGFKGKYRVVVLKNYRMIFSFDDEKVYLRRIGHRKDIYRNLEL